MKPKKIAAVIAGSVLALGAASPAFAAENLTPSSLNGALDTVARDGLRDGKPLHTNALDTENEGSVINAVKKTTDKLNNKQAKKQSGSKKQGGKKQGGGKQTGTKQASGKEQGLGKLLGGLSLGK
ncbi:hypothetical protein [Streptomyces sp. GMY02]|uniref:hypothetical protein n=1 Tax=Streptomyces sp. GMY02 TaxID=1333528 RepID=UPI0020B6C392|nr:hypothetical protein [Streptomyces sp. GMY02]